MIFSNPTTKSGLIEDIDFLVDTDSNTYKIEDKTRNINSAQDWVTGIIVGADGTWQWDDTNYTDFPIGTAALVNGQQDCSFAEEHLIVEAVEVKDDNDRWVKLKPIDAYKESTTTISELESTPGVPKYYDKIGNSVVLYPTPNYSKTLGLKVFYKRKAKDFLVSDTTRQPGFASHLHRYLSIAAAYDWATSKEHPKLNWLLNEKNRYEDMIRKFYGTRIKDVRQRIQVAYQNNK